MTSAATHGGFPIGGNDGQAQQGVGTNVGHRGRGFVPMAAYGSAARVMSPRARTPGKRGPGSRHGSAEQGNSPQAMETGSAAKRADRERDRDRNRSMGPQKTAD